MSFDPADVLGRLDGRWSLPSDVAVTRVHHGYRRVVAVEAGAVRLPELSWLWEPLNPVWSAWFSWIDPGGFILPHVDAGPYRERWQIPITSDGLLNGAALTPGVPHRVHHHIPHEVVNPGPGPRVVLVADRDVLLAIPSAPFQVQGGPPCPAPSTARTRRS